MPPLLSLAALIPLSLDRDTIPGEAGRYTMHSLCHKMSIKPQTPRVCTGVFVKKTFFIEGGRGAPAVPAGEV